MKNKITAIIILLLLSILNPAQASDTASQTVSATLSRGGGGGGGGGEVPTLPIVGGGVISGASLLAFSPVLLAGLSPNSIICAAAPIDCVCNQKNYLKIAIILHFCEKNYKEATSKLRCSKKHFFAQNDTTIFNGSFDIQPLTMPKELLNQTTIKFKATIYSDPYKDIKGIPELSFGLYRNISVPNLSRKFETQQFLHHHLMMRYEIPIEITQAEYSNGIQKISGEIKAQKLDMPDLPLMVVVKYTEGGFKKNQKNTNPKVIKYAYLIELEK